MIVGYAKEFDFDSTEPVRGEVYDQKKEELMRQVSHFAIEWMFIADLLFGAWTLGTWWLHGGFFLLVKLFAKHAPAIISMIYGGNF